MKNCASLPVVDQGETQSLHCVECQQSIDDVRNGGHIDVSPHCCRVDRWRQCRETPAARRSCAASSAVPRVTHVYAFDFSPVTGYDTVENEVRESNQQSLLIDRIDERGEILAIVRSLTSFIVKPSDSAPTIRGVRFSLFYPADPIAGHTMSQLACKLNDAAQADLAAHSR